MSPSTAELLDPLELNGDQLDAWARLSESAATANAFLDPSFVLPAVRHLPGGRRVRLLVAGSVQQPWSSLALVVPKSRWRRLPLTALGTWVHDQQGLATPLIDGRDPDRAAVDFVAALEEQVSRAGVFGQDEHAAQGRAALGIDAALAAAGWRRSVWRSSQRAVLLSGPQQQAVLIEPARLRTKRRRLERDVGPISVLDCSGPDEAEFGARTLLDLEASGWKGRQGSAMTQRPGEAAMLLDVAQAAGRAGTLRSMVLMAGESPIAAQLDLVAGDTWFHWKTAYDETRSAVSPGRLLLTHVLERFVREGLRCWDSCTVPGHPVMDGLLPDRRTIVEVAATRGAMAAAVVAAAQEARRWRARAR